MREMSSRLYRIPLLSAVALSTAVAFIMSPLPPPEIQVRDAFYGTVKKVRLSPDEWYPQEGSEVAGSFIKAKAACKALGPRSLDFLFDKVASRDEAEVLVSLELLRLLDDYVYRHMRKRDKRACENAGKVIDCLRYTNLKVLFPAACLSHQVVLPPLKDTVIEIYEGHKDENIRMALALWLARPPFFQPMADGTLPCVISDYFGPREDKLGKHFCKVVFFDEFPRIRLAAAWGMTYGVGNSFSLSDLTSGAERLRYGCYGEIIDTLEHNYPHLADQIPSFDKWLSRIRDECRFAKDKQK